MVNESLPPPVRMHKGGNDADTTLREVAQLFVHFQCKCTCRIDTSSTESNYKTRSPDITIRKKLASDTCVQGSSLKVRFNV
jgi:hypothetical protein